MSDAQFVGVLNVKFYAQLSLALVYLVERRDNNQFRYLSNSLPPSSQYVRYTKFGTHLATNCSNPSARGDTSHREIASSKNFCENPCLRSKSQKIKSDWTCATCCDDKFCCGVKDLSWFVAATHCATCCTNLSPDLYTRGDLPPRHVAATCRLVCSYRYFQLTIENNFLIPPEKNVLFYIYFSFF